MSYKSICSVIAPLVLPALLCGLAGSAFTWSLTSNVMISVVTISAAIAGSVVSVFVVSRARKHAISRLQRSEFNETDLRSDSGLFDGILHAAFQQLDTKVEEAKQSAKAKTELEARGKVHQRDSHRWRETLSGFQTPVLITDDRDQLKYQNPAAAQLFDTLHRRQEEASAIARPELACLPVVQQLVTETRTRNAATNRRTTEFELEIDGELHIYRATSTALHDDNDGLTGVSTVLTDIKDERLANTRHAEFVSSVSHELKTPMAGIKAFVEMLLDGDIEDEDEQKELYGFIDVQIDRLTRLVNNMLNLARIESGVIEIKRADCELNDVLQKALNVVEPVANEKDITVISELSDMYLAAHVDEDLFGQAAINLLSNAVKYTPQGGELKLRSRMDEGDAVIEVRDTGMGIPADALPHIFDRFYRVEQNNKAAQGTGLGLALVHYIVTDVHGGHIDVQSAVNEGTCFTIRIPLGHKGQPRRRERALASV